MAGLTGKTACLAGGGRGEIGAALRAALSDAGVALVDDGPDARAVDFAICTIGKMIIREAGELADAEVEELYAANYRLPRQFTERCIRALRRERKPGLILHLGSNAARFGVAGIEDYSAFKAALGKYLELRARAVRDEGIRLTVINFGGIDTAFWRKVEPTAAPRIVSQIRPAPEKALTTAESVAVVLSVLSLPERVAVKDALIVSRDYQ